MSTYISTIENTPLQQYAYPSTEMLISVQKYKLQYRMISPILSTQITAPVQKNYQSLSTKTYTFQSFVS